MNIGHSFVQQTFTMWEAAQELEVGSSPSGNLSDERRNQTC